MITATAQDVRKALGIDGPASGDRKDARSDTFMISLRRRSDLSDAEFRVLTICATYTDDQAPTIDEISVDACLSIGKTQAIVANLWVAGLINERHTLTHQAKDNT